MFGKQAGISDISHGLPLLTRTWEVEACPVSRQIAAYTARVTPMFIALPRAKPISVCGR